MKQNVDHFACPTYDANTRSACREHGGLAADTARDDSHAVSTNNATYPVVQMWNVKWQAIDSHKANNIDGMQICFLDICISPIHQTAVRRDRLCCVCEATVTSRCRSWLSPHLHSVCDVVTCHLSSAPLLSSIPANRRCHPIPVGMLRNYLPVNPAVKWPSQFYRQLL